VRILKAALTFGLVLVFAGSAWAGIVIDVIPSVAPNAYVSAYFGDYQSNAIYAIENGLSSYGDPSLPSYYSVAPSVLPISDNIVTGFPSWDGSVANAVGNFANEYGNRIHFGLDILGNGTQFSISELSFVGTSSDANNTLGFSYGPGAINDGYDYSDAYVGIIYGPDGRGATSEYTYVTSGPDTQPVDELVSRGSGNAWDVYANSGGGATLQDKLNTVAKGTWYDTDNGAIGPGTPYALGSSVFFTGTYELVAPDPSGPGVLASGSASVDLVATPEPISMIFFGTGLVAVGGYVARRKMQRKMAA